MFNHQIGYSAAAAAAALVEALGRTSSGGGGGRSVSRLRRRQTWVVTRCGLRRTPAGNQK